jgi:hypothetical protein
MEHSTKIRFKDNPIFRHDFCLADCLESQCTSPECCVGQQPLNSIYGRTLGDQVNDSVFD